jgi:hypothetical protein
MEVLENRKKEKWNLCCRLKGDLNNVLEYTRDAVAIVGPYRFIKWNKILSINMKSLYSAIVIDYQAFMNDEKGSFSVWVSPLEDRPMKIPASFRGYDLSAGCINLLSDNFPPHRHEASQFGFFLTCRSIPAVFLKANWGLNARYYHGFPRMHIEGLYIERKYWYNFGCKWNRKTGLFAIYINGELVDFNNGLFNIPQFRELFYVGSPYLCVSNVKITRQVLNDEDFKKNYESDLAEEKYATDPDVGKFIFPAKLEKLKIENSDWILKDYYSFRKEEDFRGWRVQGPDHFPISNLKTTNEGLLFETSKFLDPLNLCHFWSPNEYWGDGFRLEMDFRPEQEEGLALLIFLASGYLGQDFIADHGLAKTGIFTTIINGIIRSYHWEFFRRMSCTRKDIETQVLFKNPYMGMIGSRLIPKLETGKWYHMTIIKNDDRIILALNDEIVMEMVDDSNETQSPSLYRGRLGIRHMQWTRIRYKDLRIFVKDEPEVVSEGIGKSDIGETGFLRNEESYIVREGGNL